jgi:hypothetical protein
MIDYYKAEYLANPVSKSVVGSLWPPNDIKAGRFVEMTRFRFGI